MRWWLAYFLYRLARWVDPDPDAAEEGGEPVEVQYIVDLSGKLVPTTTSEPIDFEDIHRTVVYDHSHYIEENDVYHGGTYL